MWSNISFSMSAVMKKRVSTILLDNFKMGVSIRTSLHDQPYVMYLQRLSQGMIQGSPNLLIVGPGRGLGSSHNAV